MDRAKILDKIKKCLALSKSPNEHEAAAALRQAQKLMERNGITEKELGTVGYTSATIDLPVQAGKKVPLYIASFFNLIKRAFGVQPFVTRTQRVSDRSFTVIYYGPEHRVMLAEYAHDVVWRAMSRGWDAHLKENPCLKGERGARTGYYMGWLEAVRDKIEEFGMTEEEVSASRALMEQQWVTSYPQAR